MTERNRLVFRQLNYTEQIEKRSIMGQMTLRSLGFVRQIIWPWRALVFGRFEETGGSASNALTRRQTMKKLPKTSRALRVLTNLNANCVAAPCVSALLALRRHALLAFKFVKTRARLFAGQSLVRVNTFDFGGRRV